ncbi:MAG: glycine zipper 2TM domain-containing protein [Rhodospirillales bacterium]|nr:glycine zipper 2TM domain-containing protein [Rhodospirillales bacterium]
MKTAKIAIVVALAMTLAACAEGGQKENIGTVLGGVGGAVAGSQFGGGRGQLVGVAAGTLIGAFLGREIGKSLDKADMAAAQKAQDRAYAAPVGQKITWSNPESGNAGTVTPTRDGKDQSGNYCREYQTTVTVGGKTEQAYGTACRQPDGSWKVVN